MDLSLWTGKPSSSKVMRGPSPHNNQSGSDALEPQRSLTPSEDSSDVEDITYDGSPAQIFKSARGQIQSDSEMEDVLPRLQSGFFIDIPSMDEDEKNDYEHLPGHDHAAEILSQARNGRLIVRLQSGDKKSVGSCLLRSLLFRAFRNAATWRSKLQSLK